MGERQDIGFIGLGVMGLPMALNLARAGTRLVVWNRSPENREVLRAAGARVAPSAAAVFAEVETAVLMMANEAAVDAVLGRGQAVFAANVGGRTLVQMGTVSPAYSEALEAEVRAAGGRYVEAPVSGSRKPAESGELVVMLAGEPAAVAAVEPLLRPLCREAFVCGEVPKALLMKLASNAFLIPTVTGLVEAFHLAERYGLDRQQFLAVVNGGQIASAISRVKAGKLAAGDFAVQAAIADVLKNCRLAAGAARDAGLAAPLLELCRQLYEETQALGFGEADMIAVLHALEARSDGDRETPPAAPA
ncbi:3-hydroxyisobutyrate dehydrogenase [Tistlia consotensis]|uniref:3-hydroxyisobutyrate dehydrogenase n=1 Tax=Tistlia consotensis USBA 355 TaxID=560819 RepID=A0A1Y6BAH6_9PROT|nr:NAD(P)-dependent oxidoreductase [Tistlia consotensis]SME99547.1 3-hydroxyisobutyrate dehydrogenase [Tistlia consotensis USBA 355]SNR76655.1 3-hydroxyisobutyrate dehydrogenase [Tistlia consotensis]